MISKTIFRQEIKDILLRNMLEGKIKPDERLSLPGIANELDISVTPVREALTQLTETGIVVYRVNRGFFVANITEAEAIEVYQLIILLECEAVRNCSYTKQQLEELTKINDKFSAATSIVDRVQYDTLFHQKLIEGYANQSAKKIIEDIRSRISLYELKFMDVAPISDSAEMHRQIVDFLREKDANAAIKVLQQNWEIAIQYINDIVAKG